MRIRPSRRAGHEFPGLVGCRRRPSAAGGLSVLAAALALIFAAGCGGEAGDSEPSARAAPDAAAFPAAQGRTIEQLLAEAEPSELVVTPVGQVYREGPNRYGFAVFKVDRTPVLDADVALYFGRGEQGPAVGPLPARVESMETKPAFAAMTTNRDEDAARAVYVVPDAPLNRPGEWRGVALIREDGTLKSARLPSPVVGRFGEVPDIGERAPRMHTPTPQSVGGDLERIDTRVPPTGMHADLAGVLGRKPVLLLFATPQLCQSRVCGPVVDALAQVEAETPEGAAEFIHMEIFNENDPAKGLRPQVRRYGLPTEPWLFAIDSRGVIRERIEGAFGLGELRRAVRRVTSG